MIRFPDVTWQPIGQVLPGALAQIVRQAPLSHGKVDFAWRSAVGTQMARVSAVHLEDGVLLVEVQTAQWGKAVVHLRSCRPGHAWRRHRPRARIRR